jgi:hypothetical protein
MLRIVIFLPSVQNGHLKYINQKCYCLSQLAEVLHGVTWPHSRSTYLYVFSNVVHTGYMLSNFPEAYSVCSLHCVTVYYLLVIYQQQSYSGPGHQSVLCC